MARKRKRSVPSSQASNHAAPLPARRTCGTMANHMRLLELNPTYRDRLFKLEQQTATLRSTEFRIVELPIATIRIVVNVVYNDAAQNISDAQIKSQITALNADFRAKNTDRTKTPTPFSGLVSDARVQFVLDRTTRTRTTRRSFSDDDAVKKAATGGAAPVDTRKFLNVWVCALTNGLLGYAQFPGGPAATDGVVIHFQAFGTNGTARAPFNKGRSATHEIGHYLNLRHIWGDTPDCSGSDSVADTPNAAGPNYGTPSFPKVSCNNGPNGDMFMNYMDYTDDAAMFMFTAQQIARMRAALDGPRRTLW
jgi:hypothetical protein